MAYTREYVQLFGVTKKIPSGRVKPRNIYKIRTYSGGDPRTKTGDKIRYVFVIGEVDNKIHCLKLNDIKPNKFIEFLNNIRDKRIPIKTQQDLRDVLQKFNNNGQLLFESHIKGDDTLYSKKLNNYRIYLVDKIVNMEEVRFEPNLLREIFREGNNETLRRNVVTDEIKEKDG
jgi:hypothetical protein